MSAENLELVRQGIEEFNETHRFGPKFENLLHPHVSFQDEIGAYQTREELRHFLEGFAEAIGGLRIDVQEGRDLGDTILLRVIQSGRGSASAAPVEQPFTWVMRFEGARCVRWRIWAEHAKALEDAGLTDQPTQ